MSSNFYVETEDFDLYFVTKVELIIEFFLTLFGNALYVVIVNYEQYGGDPMKRSLVNKLISSICLACIGGSLTSALSLLLRALFGGIGETLAGVMVTFQAITFQFININIIFIFLFKDLSILAFNFVNHLDEGFWFIFSLLFNALMSILVYLVEVEHSSPFAKALAGVQIGDSSLGSGLLLGTGAVIMFLSHFGISFYKTLKYHQSPVETQANVFNNVVHNPNVLNDCQLLLVSSIFIATAGIPVLLTGGESPKTADELFLLLMPLRMGMGLIFPLMFFIFNPAIRVYFKREFWDWAPDCIQSYNPYLLTLEIPLQERNGARKISTVPSQVSSALEYLRVMFEVEEAKNSVQNQVDPNEGTSSDQPENKRYLYASDPKGSVDLEYLETYLHRTSVKEKPKFSKNGGKGVKSSKTHKLNVENV